MLVRVQCILFTQVLLWSRCGDDARHAFAGCHWSSGGLGLPRRNHKEPRGNLAVYRDYFIHRLRDFSSGSSNKLDFATCRLLLHDVYVDPSKSWLSGGARTVKICDSVNKAKAILSPRNIYIFDAKSLMHMEQERCIPSLQFPMSVSPCEVS